MTQRLTHSRTHTRQAKRLTSASWCVSSIGRKPYLGSVDARFSISATPLQASVFEARTMNPEAGT
jgi:hypothetical protein